MLQLANILHSHGFSITIIHTNFNSPNPSNHPHFTFHFISENLSETELRTSSDNLLALVALLNTRCVEAFHDCLDRLMNQQEEEPVACLISDAILPFTQAVADKLKLPRIVLRTGGASSFVVFAAFPLLRERGYLPIQDSKLEEPVVELPPLKVKDLPVIDNCGPQTLDQVVDGMVNGAKRKAIRTSVPSTLKRNVSSQSFTETNLSSRPIYSSSARPICFKGFQTRKPNRIRCRFEQKVLNSSHLSAVSVFILLDCLAELLGGGGDDDDDVACLITDAAWYFTQAVADTLKLPRIVLLPTSVCFFNAFTAIPLLYEKGCLPMQDFQLETPVLEIPPLRYKDLPIFETHDPENSIRFTKDVDCLAELLGGGDDDDDVACLITDAVWYFTRAVADTLKLPRIVLFPTSVSFYNPMIAVPLLYEKGCLPMQDFQLETPVPEIPPLRYKDLPIVETHDPESFIRFSKNFTLILKNV
ncbi:hypothetical protein Q3G72_012433 [Acer saccharum]|nr:hypothetical protein Q3G72_012433 [Acer saccharum]